VIVRRWRASALDERMYVRNFRRRVLPQLRQIRGFSGAMMLRRAVAAGVDIEVLTMWTSMAAIRRFAGRDAERAVVEPQARAALKRFERCVRHYQVVAFDGRAALGW
jgi:heme-degrading monooxygenase HmoA